MKTVNICGIPHTIEEIDKTFNDTMQIGEIDHTQARIYINANVDENVKKMALCHEIVHGIFSCLGYDELCQDEKLVTALGTAINQSFEVKLGN